MKWFQSDANTPNHPTSRIVKRRLGMAGFGAMYQLWCFVAERGGAEPGRAVDSDGDPYSREALIEASELEAEQFDMLVEILVAQRCMDPDAWRERGEMYFPGMAKRSDQYTRRRQGKAGGRPVPANTVPTLSEKIPTPSEKVPTLSEKIPTPSEKVQIHPDTVRTDPDKTPVQDNTKQVQDKRSKEREGASPSRPPSHRELATELKSLWNEILAPPFPRWDELNDNRVPKAAARMKQYGRVRIRDALERIHASRFCRGENDRGWMASPDWLLKVDSMARVFEGKYDNRDGDSRPKQVGQMRAEPGKYAHLVKGRTTAVAK